MKKLFQDILLTWLRITAQLQLKKNRPYLIGITGSAGKTSTVNAVAQVLKTKYRVKQTNKGNSETGLPMELLNIPIRNYTGLDWLTVILQSLWQLLFYWPDHQVFVAEMGVDSDQYPKNMSYLLRIFQPQAGVVLNIGHVHGANFSGKNSAQAIAQEKVKLLNSLPANGLAIYSLDHPEIKSNLATAAQVKTFSLHQRADAQLLQHEVSLTGTKFTFLYNGQHHHLQLDQQLHLKEAFGSVAAALLIGQKFGIEIEAGLAALAAGFKLPPSRMSLIPGINDTFIIDSSYNSSLEPALGALQLLENLSHRGRKIAVLGDMREIGAHEKADHQELVTAATKIADELVLVGPLMKKHGLPKLKQLKFSPKKTHWFLNAHQAKEFLQTMVAKHDLILVKGSQNTIFLEIVVKGLMREPKQATKLICRQTPYWKKQHQKLLA